MICLLRHPGLWLSLAWLGATTLAAAAHGFHASVEPDSQTYLAFDWSSPAAALSHLRTCGYPLFLALVKSLSTNAAAIPVAHWIAWLLADWLLFRGLVRAGYRPFVAAGAAGIVLFGHPALTFTPVVLADSLACSTSVAAAGCFLATTSCACRRWNWVGLTFTTCIAYLVRPAYLFLIPLWPVLWLLLGWTLYRAELPLRLRWIRAARYVAATVVPFVGFCTLRWAVVGHFGLVSFGGYNLIGVVGQFLDRESIDRLPGDLQPLASEFLRRRESLPGAEPPSDYLAMERMFNPTVWQAAVPAAETVADDHVQVNAQLSRLSRSLLMLYRPDYIRWLAWNGKHAIRQAGLLMMTDRGVQLLAFAWLLQQAVALWRGPLPAAAAAGDNPRQRHVEAQLLFWVAVGFTAAKTLLVILVEPAIGRYMMAATVLLPAALVVIAVHSAGVVAPSWVAVGEPCDAPPSEDSRRPNQPVTRS